MTKQDTAQAGEEQTWLLAYAVGPVSDFVAAARRMRDFWYGSRLLSELCQHAAGRAQQLGGTLVFPSLEVPITRVDSAAWLPNRGAVIWRGPEPAGLARALRKAVDQRLSRLSGAALRTFLKDLPDEYPTDELINVDWYRSQIKGLPEFYAAWVRCDNPEDPDAYRSAYQRLQRELLARKRTRDFLRVRATEPAGHPKSALDASRPSVLERTYLSECAAHQRRLGIEGDPLDAPGLLKRVLGRRERFPAVTRVAIDPWVRRLAAIDNHSLHDLGVAFEAVRTAQPDLVSASRPHESGFEFDGQLLLTDRLNLARAVAQTHACKALSRLQELRQRAIKLVGEPDPYLALMAVDLDHFGERLWQSDLAGQTALARLAAGFARASALVARKASGFVIHGGGDESLIMLPLPAALDCAEQLHQHLNQLPDAQRMGVTVSIGVSMAHALTPLRRLREQALGALRLAKLGERPGDEARDALAVVAQPRAGGEIRVRVKWSTAGALTGSARLATWQAAFESGSLPRTAPHALRAGQQLCRFDRALSAAALRRFEQRRRVGGGPAGWLNAGVAAISDPAMGTEDASKQLVSEWLLARWLSARGQVI